MGNEWVVGRTTLHGEDPGHRSPVSGSSPQPVHGLGRQRGEMTVAQRPGRSLGVGRQQRVDGGLRS